jgi:hypothetical protein
MALKKSAKPPVSIVMGSKLDWLGDGDCGAATRRLSAQIVNVTNTENLNNFDGAKVYTALAI